MTNLLTGKFQRHNLLPLERIDPVGIPVQTHFLPLSPHLAQGVVRPAQGHGQKFSQPLMVRIQTVHGNCMRWIGFPAIMMVHWRRGLWALKHSSLLTSLSAQTVPLKLLAQLLPCQQWHLIQLMALKRWM